MGRAADADGKLRASSEGPADALTRADARPRTMEPVEVRIVPPDPMVTPVIADDVAA